MKSLLSAVAFGSMLAALPALGAIPEQVTIDSGRIAGTVGRDASVRVFKGIPFAAPPTGENRWRAPQPVAKWQGVREAQQFGLRCTQGGGGPGGRNAPPSGEDCLYLNVWTTADTAGAARPVMVFIYGGGFFGGSGSEARYDGEALAKKGAVIVTLNYRLGAFGFFAHPLLTAESPEHSSGNYGMMDAIAALQWAQRNIEVFGGDPKNVTLFGESAGAIMIAALVGSPPAKGLFERAIAQSGAWMGLGMAPMGGLARAEKAGAEAAEMLGAKSLAELRAKPADEIQRGLRGAAGLVVDGYLIPKDLSLEFADGRQNRVDVLVGSNKDEGTFFSRGGVTAEQFKERLRQRFDGHAEEALALYPAGTDEEANTSSLALFADEAAWHMRRFAELQADLGARAYLYHFTHVPPAVPGRPSRGATHTAELSYMFDNLDGATPWTDADRSLADTMSQYWVNFAAKGDPNGPGLPRWPALERETGRAMILGDVVEPAAATTPPEAKLEFFDAAYERLKQALN